MVGRSTGASQDKHSLPIQVRIQNLTSIHHNVLWRKLTISVCPIEGPEYLVSFCRPDPVDVTVGYASVVHVAVGTALAMQQAPLSHCQRIVGRILVKPHCI